MPGMVKNELASFWRPALSHAFADAGPSPVKERSSSPPGLRKGSRTPTAELKAKARAMREADYSYSQIAHARIEQGHRLELAPRGLNPNGGDLTCRSWPSGKFRDLSHRR